MMHLKVIWHIVSFLDDALEILYAKCGSGDELSCDVGNDMKQDSKDDSKFSGTY